MKSLPAASTAFLAVVLIAADCRAELYAEPAPSPDARRLLDEWTGRNIPFSSVFYDGGDMAVAVAPGLVDGTRPLPRDMGAYVDGLRNNGREIRSVFLNNETWMVVADRNLMHWQGREPPRDMIDYIRGAVDAGATVRSVCFFGPVWIVATDRGIRKSGPTPPGLDAFLGRLQGDRRPMRSISLAPNGRWVVVFD